MNREQYLLVCLMEECNEVAKEFAAIADAVADVGIRASKALRFGLDEIQPGQPLTNAERIACELVDLMATARKMIDAGIVPADSEHAKSMKLDKFMELSRKLGILRSESATE